MQRTKVVIIEDDGNTATNLRIALDVLNYSVVGVAVNALDAIDLLNHERADIAIINPELKGEKNGIWVGHMINKKYQVPFIFLSDTASHTCISNAMLSNPGGFVMKPFSKVNISAALQLALQNFTSLAH